MRKFAFAFAAAAMTGALTSIAIAPASAEPAQVVIDTGAYNLASASGHDALAARIRRAGNLVCGADNQRTTRANRDFQSCHSAAVGDGMSQLTALTGRALVTVVASR